MNQIVRYLLGRSAATPNSGKLLVGASGLLDVASTAVCGICTDPSGNVFVTDSEKHVVLKIDATGHVSTYAGLSGTSGNNGSSTVTGANARFNKPQGITCDRNGVLYVADTGNNQIRRIDLNRNVGLLAGSSTGESGFTDGALLWARFDEPHGIAVDACGHIYVADGNNHSIRVIGLVSAKVSTVAGNGTPGDASGYGANARFNHPQGVAVNPSGHVLVADSDNHRLKIIYLGGPAFNFSGSGVSGTVVGVASSCRYQTPRFCDCDRSGNWYVIDWTSGTSSRLVRVDPNGTSSLVIDFPNSEDPYVTGVAVDASGAMYVAMSGADILISSSSSSESSTELSETSSVSSFSSNSVSSSS